MAKEYFSDLNYTLANEDTRVEWELLPANVDRVFSIAGSGARCLPLLAKKPKNLDVIDMSVSQLYLCELRLQAMKNLSYGEYLFLMGYRGALQGGPNEGDDREALYRRLKLSPEATAYWNERVKGWKPKGFILLGRWESHFQKIGVLFRDYLKCDFTKIFETQSLAEQAEAYEKYWPKLRWNSFIRVVASEYVFNKFLYKGHFSGKSDHRTEQRPPSQFIMEEFERIFKTQLVRKNYFMQILFLGKIAYEEGLPLEAHEDVVEAVKKSKTEIRYLHGNLLEELPKHAYDFISLSDTISYLPQQEANQILQRLHPDTKSGSQMVIRSFMRAPTAMDLKSWQELVDKNMWAQNLDGTGVYQFHIFKKN
ncbi:transferase [Bdellovibrio bacteriovorus]|uniref:Transferase n=1 Tax=Bdellovibrio bacteriovorus TaxID=959 RepID=A0A150WNG1_BDEBC|nr:DUF3419 family protein [Bdellovibrio bacteriovorus]KYG66033.1 transferase [Bdellovibrio bacteriovorus]